MTGLFIELSRRRGRDAGGGGHEVKIGGRTRTPPRFEVGRGVLGGGDGPESV